MSAAAVLTILRDGETLKSVPIEGEAMLGRSDGCVIRLDDRAVSRQHALFRPVAGGVQIEKRSDFAPLSVNGGECTSAILKEGDVIAIGPYLIRVNMGKGSAMPSRKDFLTSAPAFDDESPASVGTGSPTEPVSAPIIQMHQPAATAAVPVAPKAATSLSEVLGAAPVPTPAALSEPETGSEPASGLAPVVPLQSPGLAAAVMAAAPETSLPPMGEAAPGGSLLNFEAPADGGGSLAALGASGEAALGSLDVAAPAPGGDAELAGLGSEVQPLTPLPDLGSTPMPDLSGALGAPSGEAAPGGDPLGSLLEQASEGTIHNLGAPAGDIGLGAAPTGSESLPQLGGDSPLSLGTGSAIPSLSEAVASPEGGTAPVQLDAPAPDGMVTGGGETTGPNEDGATRISPVADLQVKLVFAPGDANVPEFEINKNEISIGRGNTCDVILGDKKVSRKHAVIARNGLRFTIRDLKSANGIYVNGMRVEEHDLESGDRIRIGAAEFQFLAKSSAYDRKEQDFIDVPDVNTVAMQSASQAALIPSLPSDLGGVLVPPPVAPNTYGQGLPVPQGQPGALPGGTQLGIPGAVPGIGGIAGINGATKPKTLMEKFRALPKRRQYLWIVIVLGLVYFLLFDEDEQSKPNKKPKPRPSVMASGQATPSDDRSFDALSPEQKKFIESEHALAFEYYRNQEYDKALYELDKIFAIIPDYKDSREIQRYAREGQRKKQALLEEQRKKAEEARLKAKVAALVEETRTLMAKKAYEQARELFSQILALDPDNKEVAEWRTILDQYEEQRRLREQELAVQKEINDRAWAIYNEGVALKKQGKYHAAIDVFGKVAEIGATDKRVNAGAKAQIGECLQAIARLRDPVLAEAKEAEANADLPKAFNLYKKATQIDPKHPAGYKGMERIRTVLHDRAKTIYTEAVLAESYSDFTTARKKYQDVLNTAPSDDIYHERAERKLARYFTREEASQQ